MGKTNTTTTTALALAEEEVACFSLYQDQQDPLAPQELQDRQVEEEGLVEEGVEAQPDQLDLVEPMELPEPRVSQVKPDRVEQQGLMVSKVPLVHRVLEVILEPREPKEWQVEMVDTVSAGRVLLQNQDLTPRPHRVIVPG